MIAVTGATGFIGSHLIAALCLKKENLVAIFRSEDSIQKTNKILDVYNISQHDRETYIQWEKADVCDVFSLLPVFEKVDYVYHCAGFVSFNPADKRKLYLINAEGTANVVNAALEVGIKKICHVSSIAALGDTQNGELIDEKTAWETSEKHSNYSKSKYLAENEMWRGAAEGLTTVIASPSVILGETSDLSGNGALFGLLKKGMKYYTTGTTGFVDVKDVCNSLLQLMQADLNEEKFIISSENLSFKNVLTNIARSLEKPAPFKLASPKMLSFAWRSSKVISFFTRKSPSITQEVASNSVSMCFYDNKKSREVLGLEYQPVNLTIERLGEYFKNLEQ